MSSFWMKKLGGLTLRMKGKLANTNTRRTLVDISKAAAAPFNPYFGINKYIQGKLTPKPIP
jgi:hypothetical protein